MKIFLAGNDSEHYALVLAALGYPYRLVSYYKVNRPDHMAMRLAAAEPEVEWLMDSGLFSLMFGSEQGKLNTYSDYAHYAEKYVEEMIAWKWKNAIVECDVQRVLGVPETFKLRDEIFRPSGLEVVYVWHIPEGQDGLVELARRERRVALSVPEFRSVYVGNRVAGGGGGRLVHQAILRGIRLIREAKNPQQRLHLLGNTERGLLGAPKPADTCDSTSWLGAGRYGNGMLFNPGTGDVVSISAYSPKWKAWRTWCERTYAASFELMRESFCQDEKRWVYYGNAMCSAIAYVLWMERINGSVKLLTPKTLPKAES